MANQTNTGFRLAHTMIRVVDLEASLKFYCDILGMQVLRRTDYPEGKFTNTFIGYGPEESSPTLELALNWGREEPYEKGDAYGHICIETPDVYKACEDLAAAGVNITRAPGPMKNGTRVIAFCEDPDGYKVELNESILKHLAKEEA
ncbi:lactoylglutathione lyase [Ruegeria sp. EL01]|jgi:lactoylglutathione lyase|uniref:lactoylglutathione lyase n=1 Tax=Ruegeria sp. EL01 TaxID=2107578 RepID=UPI000EA81C69|nr:lactoylglutathione lyase [Ruegeria sp. EL01]